MGNLSLYSKILLLFLLTPFFLSYFSPDSFSQVFAACPSSGTSIQVYNGFLTDPNNPNRTITTDQVYSVGGAGSTCIIDTKATIPQFSILSFAEMKSLYFDQAPASIPPSAKVELSTGDRSQIDIQNQIHIGDLYKLILVNGNLNLSGNIFFPPTNPEIPVVIFVTGKLTFNADFPGAAGNTGGVVFIVQEDINVRWSTNSINAIMITGGTFCSASMMDGSCPTTPYGASALQINGSLISLDPNLPPQFVRITSSSSLPSEEIVYQSKYIVLFKDIFSREQSIWSEVQN